MTTPDLKKLIIHVRMVSNLSRHSLITDVGIGSTQLDLLGAFLTKDSVASSDESRRCCDLKLAEVGHVSLGVKARANGSNFVIEVIAKAIAQFKFRHM